MAMDRKVLEITLKEDFRDVFKSETDDVLNKNIEVSLAIAALIEKRVTLARAAELANKGLSDFINLLQKYNIPWMEYTEETFREDQEVLKELKGIIND
jgi:predicted HTH domain antitoxin